MGKQEIKTTELKAILSKYKSELNQLEKQLFDTIREYQKTVDEERSKELSESLMKHE
ncbi:MAG: hypothetical protein AAB880_01580 [Patescibacteria group bacterium]